VIYATTNRDEGGDYSGYVVVRGGRLLVLRFLRALAAVEPPASACGRRSLPRDGRQAARSALSSPRTSRWTSRCCGKMPDIASPHNLDREVRFAADSLLEGTGFELAVPLLRKALLGATNQRRRHEKRGQLQVVSETAMIAWSPLPVAVPFAVGPRVRIRLPPALSQRRTGPAASATDPAVWGHPPSTV
jgi:hypothetical protein